MSHVYVDVNLNSSTNKFAGPRKQSRTIIRTSPILKDMSEYDLVVSRMVLSPCLLPIWIPQLKEVQHQKAAPNETVYSVGLTCRIYDQMSAAVQQTIQGSASCIFTPTRNISPPKMTPINSEYYEVVQPRSAYCHVYDVAQLIEMFNRAFLVAYIQVFQELNGTQWASEHATLMQQLEAPYFSYDFNAQNLKLNGKPFVLYQDITVDGAVSIPYMDITISFSADCYPILQGFYCKYNNLNTSISTPFDIEIIPVSNSNLQRGLYLTQAGVSPLGPQYLEGPPYNFEGTSKDIIYNSTENVPTIAVWQQSFNSAIWTNLNAVQSIQLLCDINTMPELTDDTNLVVQSSSSYVLCDFYPDTLQAGNLSSNIVYNSPTIDTGRRINLLSNGPLIQFSVSAVWTDAGGNQFPMLSTDYSRVSTVKLCFIKR